MDNTYVILNVCFGGILLSILLTIMWATLRNLKKRIFPNQDIIPNDIVFGDDCEKPQKSHRTSIAWPVTIETSQKVLYAKTKDLDLVGAFIVCDDPLPLNEQFDLAIEIPGQELLKQTAEVIWSNGNIPKEKIITCGMKIRFIRNSNKEKESLHKAIIDYYIDS